MSRPSLFIVIGANGAGKTTWTDDNRNLLPTKFYNADSIAKGLGDPSLSGPQTEAREIVDQKIRDRMEAQETFGFESTWSGNSRPAIVINAKQSGYETTAVFIGTESADINVQRVAKRVSQHGHDVPESEIRRRWHAAPEKLIEHWGALDHIQIFDNSGSEPRLLFTKEHNHERRHPPIPPWANAILTDPRTQPPSWAYSRAGTER